MANGGKIGVIFAGLAFCVSFIFGLLGGVGFGTIILRAFLGAVIFGAAGFGADVLLRRALPELFAAAGEDENGVDITVPEINPHDKSAGDEFDGDAGGGEAVFDEGDGEADDLVEEIEELPRSDADAASPSAAASQAGGGQEADGGEPEDLDVLPDVGDLDASFAAGEESESGVLSKSSRGGGKASAITEDNPALIAKALQTVLKRDNGG